MADLGQFPFKVRGVDLADTARIDAKGPAVSILDTAVFPEDRQVAAGGSFGVTGTAAGSVIASGIAGAASGAVSVDGVAAGVVSSSAISGAGAGSFDAFVSATATTISVVLYRGDDAPDWRKRFYDRQVREFEEAIEAIPRAADPQDAAQEAVEAFAPLAVSTGEAKAAAQAISEALRGLTMQSLRRKEVQREVADMKAELAAIEAYRRKKRNNEAAMLLLV